MEFRRRLTSILPTLAIALPLAFPVHSDSGDIERAAGQLLDAGAAGLSMALIEGNGMTWSASRGYADIATGRPMSIDTIMNIASISKTVTAASLMLLVERGKLDLDKDINVYLPFSVVNPQHPRETITTRHLLTHSSAIIDREDLYFSETSYHTGGDNPLPLGQFLQAYLLPGGEYYKAGNFADYPPGGERKYSNIGFGLAGYLVEILSGLALDQFSAQHIFRPLGMDSTGWMLIDIDRRRHAKLYEWKGKERAPVEWYGLATWPDGGLRTSARDLARFFAAMIGGGQIQGARILEKDTVDAMFTPQFAPGRILAGLNESENHRQALAWSYRRLESGKSVLGHGGGDPGVATDAQFFPGPGVGAILLVNTSSETEKFRQAFEELMNMLLNAALEGIE